MGKFKIVIAGIGGVGGYIGAKLARTYFNSDEAEIHFYARGKNMEQIRLKGIQLKTSKEEFSAFPLSITHTASDIGLADLIICSTKSYHLEEVMTELSPCISERTIILPLLNGVNAPEKIKELYPEAPVWDGCIYIVSRLTAPGMIEQKGNVNSLHFGAKDGKKEAFEKILSLLSNAGIDARHHDNSEQVVWEKYIFISSIGSLTTYLNTGIGTILNTPEHKKILLDLLNEIIAVAKAKSITLSEDLIRSILTRLASLPPETTSSMQADYMSGKQTEADSLTGYVIREAKKYGIQTPNYEKIYAAIKK